jgi:hypothetical protein
MNESELEVLKNIERHLKNISISLHVMEERQQKYPAIANDVEYVLSARKCEYDFVASQEHME